MITKRDKEIVEFINAFSKTYYKVLGETFFNNEQVARNRINLLIKEKILRTVKLDLEEINSPRTCIVLGAEGKKIISDLGKPLKDFRTTKRINHNLYEQIAYFYLSKVTPVERTTIANHYTQYKHIPDFIIHLDNKTLFVEIELSLKSPKRYIELVTKCLNSDIENILYIVLDDNMALKIRDYLPDNLRSFINFYYISFENLKTNVLTHSKIKPNKYPKTNNYKKTIETLTEKKKEVLEPIMNDLEPKEITEKETITVQEDFKPVEKVEIQEIQTPIIAEKTEIKDSKPHLFSFSKAKLALIIGVLCLILGIILAEQTQLGLWIRYFFLSVENFVLSLFI